MSGMWGHVSGVVTVLLLIVFLGIWFWAWRPRHKRNFDHLAAMPLEDLEGGDPESSGPSAANAKPPGEHR